MGNFRVVHALLPLVFVGLVPGVVLAVPRPTSTPTPTAIPTVTPAATDTASQALLGVSPSTTETPTATVGNSADLSITTLKVGGSKINLDTAISPLIPSTDDPWLLSGAALPLETITLQLKAGNTYTYQTISDSSGTWEIDLSSSILKTISGDTYVSTISDGQKTLDLPDIRIGSPASATLASVPRAYWLLLFLAVAIIVIGFPGLLYWTKRSSKGFRN